VSHKAPFVVPQGVPMSLAVFRRSHVVLNNTIISEVQLASDARVIVIVSRLVG